MISPNNLLQVFMLSVLIPSTIFTNGVPDTSDPATTDPSARFRVCEDICNSGVFTTYKMEPINMRTYEVYNELQQPKYLDIFNMVYRPSKSQNSQYPHEYFNPYRPYKFEVTEYFPSDGRGEPISVLKKEYAFMCLLRVVDSSEETAEDDIQFDENYFEEDDPDEKANNEYPTPPENLTGEENSDDQSSNELHSGDIIPFYVSKIYGVHRGLHAHRFIFTDGRYVEDEEVMLVGESAKAYTRIGFNVELHYLELRKYQNFRPETNCAHDPIVKLNLGYFNDNQHFQLCATVLTSSYFKGSVEYPRRVHHQHWYNRTISFRTEEGLKESKGKLYKELMVECEASMTDGEVEKFFISRAYNSNHVFVYVEINHKLYLENLSKNVSIVHENYHFGAVET